MTDNRNDTDPKGSWRNKLFWVMAGYVIWDIGTMIVGYVNR